MLLYEHPLSSYAQKVKIALREKGLDFTVETPAALGTGTAGGAFAEASPRNEVPTLIDGETRDLRFDDHPRISRGQVSLPAFAAARSGGTRRSSDDRGSSATRSTRR